MEFFLRWPLLLLVPFLSIAYGGVQGWSVGILEITVFFIMSIVFFSGRYNPSIFPAEKNLLYLSLLAVALIILQLVPLPPSLLDMVGSSRDLLKNLNVDVENRSLPGQISINRGATAE